MRVVVLLPLVALFGACALERGGSLESGLAQSDGGTLAPGDPCEASEHACDAVAVLGWSPVAFTTGRLECPTGYAEATHPVTQPEIHDGACKCDITARTFPDCQTGTLSVQRDDYDKKCGTFGGALKVGGGSCRSTGYVYLGANQSLAALSPVGGGCTAAPSSDSSVVSTTTTTACAPTTCRDALCVGKAPAGFLACVRHDGDVPCATEFPNKTLTGVAAVVSRCGACDCKVTSASCSNAKADYFTDSACAQFSATVVANAVCAGVQLPRYANSVRYTATVSATFDAGRSSPTVELVAPSTVCCP